MKKEAVAPLFYFGTLVSGVGSFAFNVCLIAFMVEAGFHLGEASLIVGLQRLVPALFTGLWGHFTDRLPAKPTVLVTEIVAALISVGLLFVWSGSTTNYALLSVLCVIRAVMVGFQMGSRAKITKLLGDETYAGNSKHAIWFNKSTQGATLFSGLVAWYIIKNFNLEAAILFDAASFILNGVIIFLLPVSEGENEREVQTSVSWKKKFSDLFTYNPKAAYLDILLAVSMMGTVAFMSRVAGADQSWTGKFMASFGLAVWVAGFLERKLSTKIISSPFWLILGAAFAAIGFIAEPGWSTLAIFFVKDLAYWIILHRISSHIQMDSPTKVMGSISSARMTIMVVILACGEIFVGGWSQVVPLSVEGLGRGFVAMTVAVYLWRRKPGAELNDRPAL